MTVLIVGASGATGHQLIKQLLKRTLKIRIIVRNPDKLPDDIKGHDNILVIQASILDLSDEKIVELVNGCDAVASCLGHNINLKGIFGKPRMLVADATHRLCNAIKANYPKRPVKFVLMNTTGNSNRDIPERLSLPEKCVMSIIRLLLPPQRDNEKAAEYLRTGIGQNDKTIEWIAVRPDTLINEPEVSIYEVFSSPVRSPIFNAGATSRINVAHFMADLVTDDNIWSKWKGKMPVIYNTTSSAKE